MRAFPNTATSSNSRPSRISCYLLDTRELWLFHDQIFVKQSGNNGPTFWHQDLPYWIIDGTQIGSMWITLDPIPKKYCLEFIPGSHRGPQYGGSGTGPGPGMQRRTISFRFYGDDVVMDGRFARANQRPEPYYPGLSQRLQPGDPMRDPRFPRLRPEN